MEPYGWPAARWSLRAVPLYELQRYKGNLRIGTIRTGISAPGSHRYDGVMALAAHAAATVAAVMPLDGMCAALSRGHNGCASLPHTRLHC